MRLPLLAPAGLLCLVACTLGPEFKNFGPAHGPAGVRVEASMSLSGGPPARTGVDGELLEVRAEGLLLLGTLGEVREEGQKKAPPPPAGATARVVLVPFARIQKARFEGMGRRCELNGGVVPKDELRNRLRLVSRFPQGLTPDLLRRLLETRGQTEVQRLGGS
jgi:hypothetical protein